VRNDDTASYIPFVFDGGTWSPPDFWDDRPNGGPRGEDADTHASDRILCLSASIVNVRRRKWPEVAVNIVGKHCQRSGSPDLQAHFCCRPEEGRVSEYFVGTLLSTLPMT
jgi:hypothetical protein